MSSNFSSTDDVRRVCASRIGSPSRSADVSARSRASGWVAGKAAHPGDHEPTTFRQWCEQVLKPAVLA
jgi:hypothetical protein